MLFTLPAINQQYYKCKLSFKDTPENKLQISIPSLMTDFDDQNFIELLKCDYTLDSLKLSIYPGALRKPCLYPWGSWCIGCLGQPTFKQ
jgi:hypothetical protein